MELERDKPQSPYKTTPGSADPNTSQMSPVPRSSFTYGEDSDSANSIPLSMKMLHKPSRSKQLLEKASDRTKVNSLINRHLDEDPLSMASDSTSPTTSPPPVSATSPSLSPASSPDYKLVRKKSGEVLKPSLKDSSSSSYFYGKRSQSLPTTPTYKQVHFGCDTDVRYFKVKDKPNTISASNSPTFDASRRYRSFEDDDDTDSDDQTEDDFDLNNSGPSVNWQLKLLNFAPLSYTTKIEAGTPVFLERLFITVDKKYLLGHIAVKNIAFEKHLTVRYSLDDWLTITEIPTIYVPDRPDILKSNNYDRFTFQIPLDNLFNSFRLDKESNNSKTYHDGKQENTYQLCIKYNTTNEEFWDNNNLANYTIKLIKSFGTPRTKPSLISSRLGNPKPKYSSSYLKSRASDSNIPSKADKTKPSEPSLYSFDNSSSDFVKNDFYLSSPLLSSLNQRSKAQDDKNKEKFSEITDSPSFKFNTSSKKDLDSYPSYKDKFNQNQKQDLNKPAANKTSRNILDSKAYKELLDNYCFFSTSSSEIQDDNHQSSKDKNDVFTSPFNVSSFLGS